MNLKRLKRSDRPPSAYDSRLHVEDARTISAAAADAERHPLECPEIPDRVQVAEQQNRLGTALRGDAPRKELRRDGGTGGAVIENLDTRALSPEFTRQVCCQPVDRRLRVAGGFDFDRAAKAVEHRRKLGPAICQQRPRIQVCSQFSAWTSLIRISIARRLKLSAERRMQEAARLALELLRMKNQHPAQDSEPTPKCDVHQPML